MEPSARRAPRHGEKKELGSGAFARVFKVHRRQDDKIYALKKVRISGMKNREIADTLGEIRFLASIRHPNLIRYYDSYYDEKVSEICIVMEYADAGDIASKISKCIASGSFIAESTIWSIFIQLLEGISYLHRKKILHRDLKSANCFLTSDGKVKIGDLNVSKLMKAGLLRTQIGTPYFMSPEIYLRKPYGEHSDMWSLGCILYDMCCLRPPFRGRDIDDLGRRVVAGSYPSVPARYSKDVATVLSLLLATDPRKRYTAAQLLEHPIISVKRSEMEAMRASMRKEVDVGASMPMVGTIAVPAKHAIRRIGDMLPSPKYDRLEAGKKDEESFYASLLEAGVRDIDHVSKPLFSVPTKGAISASDGRLQAVLPTYNPVNPTAPHRPVVKGAGAGVPTQMRGRISDIVRSAREEVRDLSAEDPSVAARGRELPRLPSERKLPPMEAMRPPPKHPHVQGAAAEPNQRVPSNKLIAPLEPLRPSPPHHRNRNAPAGAPDAGYSRPSWWG